MRQLGSDDSAISEIVGALLLVLVVSTAAIAFGSFIQGEQQKEQERQALENQRKAERIDILSIAPVDTYQAPFARVFAIAGLTEGGSATTAFVIELSAVAVSPTTINFGFGLSTALSPTDVASIAAVNIGSLSCTGSGSPTFSGSTTATIAAGSTCVGISVTPAASEAAASAPKSVVLLLTSGTGYALSGIASDAVATTWIAENPATTGVPYVFAIATDPWSGESNAVAKDGSAGATLAFYCSGFSLLTPVTVDVPYTLDSASDAEFSSPASSSSVSIPVTAGVCAPTTVAFTAATDSTAEPEKTGQVTIAANTGYSVPLPITAAKLLIEDDDNPVADTDYSGEWDQLTFRISNLNTKDATILGVRVNDLPVARLIVGGSTIVFNPNSSDYATMPHDFTLAPLEQAIVSIRLGNLEFFGGQPRIATSSPVELDLTTLTTNTFTRTFIPPNAVIMLGAGGAATYLDGSKSEPGSEGAFLLDWTWNTFQNTDCSTSPVDTDEHGRLVTTSLDLGAAYCVQLEVVDQFGMKGNAQFTRS